MDAAQELADRGIVEAALRLDEFDVAPGGNDTPELVEIVASLAVPGLLHVDDDRVDSASSVTVRPDRHLGQPPAFALATLPEGVERAVLPRLGSFPGVLPELPAWTRPPRRRGLNISGKNLESCGCVGTSDVRTIPARRDQDDGLYWSPWVPAPREIGLAGGETTEQRSVRIPS
jgi:hypothetical protein